MNRAWIATLLLPLHVLTEGEPRHREADEVRIARIDPAMGELAGAPERPGPSGLTPANSVEITVGYTLETADEGNIVTTIRVGGTVMSVPSPNRQRIARGSGTHTTRLGVTCPADPPELLTGLELQVQLRAEGRVLLTETRALPHTVRCRAADEAADEPGKPDDPPVAVAPIDPILPSPRGADAIQRPPVKQPLPAPAAPVLPAPQPNPGQRPQPTPVRPLTPLPDPPQGCPDPAVVSLTARRVRSSIGWGLRAVHVEGVVRNQGPVGFRSEPGMQRVRLWTTRHGCLPAGADGGYTCGTLEGFQEDRDFAILGPGQEIRFSHRMLWTRMDSSPEFSLWLAGPAVTITIDYAYDAQAGADPEARNDDCDSTNNRRVLTRAELNALY